MTKTAALKVFRAARKRYVTAAFGDKRKSLERLVRARTELMRTENARAAERDRGGVAR